MRIPETETRLNVYRKLRKLTLEELGRVLGVTRQAASRYCLPPDDESHRRPQKAAADRLKEWSGGVVTIANYADPYTPGDLAGVNAETCGAGS